MGGPSLKDVALACGMRVETVAIVFDSRKGGRRVSRKVWRRVFDVAERIGFYPHPRLSEGGR